MAKAEATLSDLLVQLQIANRLSAVQLKSSMKQNEIIAILASTNATPKEIADVLDTSEGTVRSALNRLKAK